MESVTGLYPRQGLMSALEWKRIVETAKQYIESFQNVLCRTFWALILKLFFQSWRKIISRSQPLLDHDVAFYKIVNVLLKTRQYHSNIRNIDAQPYL